MSTTTIFQAGTYTATTDTFNLALDLNDRSTWYLDTLDLAQPEKADTRVFNIRTPGEIIERVQYKNRKITATLLLRGANAAAMLASIRSLLAAIEHPPYVLRIQLPNCTQYSYADVVRVTHDIPFDAKAWLAGAVGAAGKKRVHVLFECSPGLRGDRVVLSNAVSNPGFEAPSGPAVTVFNDPLTNTNAYAVQAGGALTQDTLTFADVVASLQGAAGASSTTLSVLRYFRLDESSGTTAYDASPNVINGTTHGSPTQGVASLLTGDTDTCYTFTKASSQYVSVPTTGLPTGNGAMSMAAIVKFSANPSAVALIWGIGSAGFGAHNVLQLYVDTNGKLNADNGSTAITGSSALSLNTPHLCVVTWDGTTMTLYADGTSLGTSTPGNQTIPASPTAAVAANPNDANFWNGQLDEALFFGGCLTSAQVTSLYNAFHVAPAATVNTLAIPANGRVSFGSPAWAAINQWSVRWRYTSALTATFYVHYTDANNYLAVVATGTSLTINHVVGGTTHQLGTQTLALVNGIHYWLQITQFPTVTGNVANVQAQNFVDNGGVAGAVTAGLLGPFATFDGVTALVGAPQMAASGATLGLGGNFSNVHTVGLFGPGGWTFTPSQNAVTGNASAAWDGSRPEIGMSGTATAGTQTYGGGPVTSSGAGRIDLPPGGTVDAMLRLYTGGTPAGTSAIPVQTAGNVLGYSAWVKESGLNAHATIELAITEYNSSGSATGSSSLTLGALTGGALPTTWTQISGTYTTHANCAYVDFAVRVVDTTVAGESANATIWVDSVQCWDQTRADMTSMPYCELRFSQSPAQLMVSGLVGDMAAPALVECGLYFSTWNLNHTATLYLGRRLQASANAQLVSPPVGWTATSIVKPPLSQCTAVLDSASYGGFYLKNGSNAEAWRPRALSPLTSDAAGVYHLLARAYTVASGFTSLQLRTITQLRQQAWFGLSSTTNADQLGEAYGAYLTPFAAQNTWTPCELGQVRIPPFPASALAAASTLYAVPMVDWAVTSEQDQIGYQALLPVDGNLYLATLINPANAVTALSAQWLYVYWDGLSLSSPYSVESSPMPNPGHSGGSIGALGTGSISVNPTGEIQPYLDPTASTTAASGVNQFVLIANDDAATLLAPAVEMVYSPLYLSPR